MSLQCGPNADKQAWPTDNCESHHKAFEVDFMITLHTVQRRLLMGALTASLTALAACGGGDSNASSTESPSGPTGSAIKATTIPPGSLEIDQDGLEFKPRQLEAAINTPVFVKNSEAALHTFNVNGKNLGGNMRKGDIIAWTTDTAGTYKVTCEFHPQMKATITVR